MILKRHMRTAVFCTQHEASCSLCIHKKNISRSAVSGDYQVLQNCSPAPNLINSLGAAFLASLIPSFLLLPKTLSSFGCSVSSRHQPAGKKLIGCHTFPPSRSTVVSMLFWKARDVAARQTDRGMRLSGNPPCGSLEEANRNEQLLAKKT